MIFRFHVNFQGVYLAKHPPKCQCQEAKSSDEGTDDMSDFSWKEACSWDWFRKIRINRVFSDEHKVLTGSANSSMIASVLTLGPSRCGIQMLALIGIAHYPPASPPMFCDWFSPIPSEGLLLGLHHLQQTMTDGYTKQGTVLKAETCFFGSFFWGLVLLDAWTPPQKKNKHQNLALLAPGKKKTLGNNSLHVTKRSTSSILLIFLPVRYKIHTKKSIGRSHLGVINISWAFCRRSCDYFMFLEIHPLKT